MRREKSEVGEYCEIRGRKKLDELGMDRGCGREAQVEGTY